MSELMSLFISFGKVGLLTFGGGMAMLPILQQEVVEHKKWATDEEIMDYYAIGQCTPGIIAVNTATFIGYRRKGILGAIFATLGMIFPSFVIITVIAAFISNFSDLLVVQYAFNGVRVCVTVLILNAVIKLLRTSVVDWYTAIIGAVIFVGMLVLSLSPIVAVIIAGILGILFKKLGGKKT